MMTKDDISKTQIRFDAREKCAGEAMYLADYNFGDVLYAKTLRSKYPRAKIDLIEIPDLPDGYYTVDSTDAPASNRVRMLIDDQPFFAEGIVNYVGEPILLVVGPDRNTISEIMDKIVVHYSEIPAIYNIDESNAKELGHGLILQMMNDPNLDKQTPLSKKKEPDAQNEYRKPALFNDDNVIADYHFHKGHVAKAGSKAKVVFHGFAYTGYQEQLYLEPQAMMAYIDEKDNNKIIIKGSMQCPYYVKNAMKLALGVDDDGVRVIQTTTGGAFGGKEDYPSIMAGQVAFAALKTKKPVILIFDRTEDIEATTKRHPSESFYKISVDKDNSMSSFNVEIKLDAGAYAGLTSVVLQRSLFAAVNVYNIPSVFVSGEAYATNSVPSGAFRGFGSPQSIFATETIVDQVARRLNIRPDLYRKMHFLKKGDTTSTGGILRGQVLLDEILTKVVKSSHYDKKYEKWQVKPLESDGLLHGIGLSTFIHGCGFTGRGEEIIKGTARLRKNTDDTVTILVSNVEMGQGAQTTLRKIVAKAVDIPISDVHYPNPDTDEVPDSGPTVASRTVMIVGSLLESLGRKLKNQWQEGKEIVLEETYRHPDYIKWDQDELKGDAYPEYSWGAIVAEVTVDPQTYELNIIHIWSVFDLGTPIDELIIQGQIEGGILQGLGYATTEVMETKKGHLQHRTISDYIIPTTMDTPPISYELVDNPYEKGPFGAKCAGELTLVGVAPAVANAVSLAIGKPVNKIPITPEYIMQLYEEDRDANERDYDYDEQSEDDCYDDDKYRDDDDDDNIDLSGDDDEMF